MYHAFFFQLSVLGYSGCFQILPTMNHASVNIEMKITFLLCIFGSPSVYSQIMTIGFYASTRGLPSHPPSFPPTFPRKVSSLDQLSLAIPFQDVLSSTPQEVRKGLLCTNKVSGTGA